VKEKMMNKLLLGVLFLPVIEIVLWIQAAHLVGGWWVFLWTLAAFFIGLSFVRHSIASVLPQLRNQGGIQHLQMDANADLPRILTRALAGVLLAIPGLLTDVFALVLLLPPVQRWVQGRVATMMAKRQQAMMAQMQRQAEAFAQQGFGAEGFGQGFQWPQGAESPFNTSQRGNVIDGEARTVQPEPVDVKRIDHAANDD
jgi:UPF0716 protein FxsA